MSAMPADGARELPHGWRWTTMGDIAEVVGGGTPRTTEPANFDGGEIPWVTPADLSGYTDKYYKPFPEGNRLAFDPLILKSAPGWPAPGPETMEYLHSLGIMHVGSDGPSMGPVEGGQATHVAGLKYGMSWDEQLTNLGKLPARGAFYIALPIKVVDGSGASTRAIGIKTRGQKGIGE